MGWRDWDNRRKGVRNYQVLLQEKASPGRLPDGGRHRQGRRHAPDDGVDHAGPRQATTRCAKARYNTPVAQYDMTSDGTRWHNHVTRGPARHHGSRQAQRRVHGVRHARRLARALPERRRAARRVRPHRREQAGSRHDVGLGRHEPQGPVLPRAAAPVLQRPSSSTCRSPRCRRRMPTTTARPTRTRPARCCTSTASSTSTAASTCRPGSRKGYLIDHGVIFINRAYGTNWDWVGSTPWEGYWNDFDAPYYPSDKYGWVEAHFPNLWGAKQKWVDYLLGINDSQNRFLPKNSAQCSWQYLYHKFGTITRVRRHVHDRPHQGRSRRLHVRPAGRHGAQDLGGRQGDLVGRRSRTAPACSGYWKDTFGYAYIVLGKNGNPQGRLDPAIYQMTRDLRRPDDAGLRRPERRDLQRASPSAPAPTRPRCKLQMYGRQTVRVKLPFAPASVECDNPQLMIGAWSYARRLPDHGRARHTAHRRDRHDHDQRHSLAPARLGRQVNDFLYQLQNLSLLKAGSQPLRPRHHRLRRGRPRDDALHARADRCLAAQPGRRQARPRLHEHRRGRDLPLVLEESLGREPRRHARHGRAVLAGPVEPGLARQLQGPLLVPGLAEDHLRDAGQLPRQDHRRRLRRRVPRHHRRLRVLGARAARAGRCARRRPRTWSTSCAAWPTTPGWSRAGPTSPSSRRTAPTSASTPSTWPSSPGIGQEDTWYNGDAVVAVDGRERARAQALQGRRQAGALHRLLPAARAHRPLLRKAQALGFVPYATVRDLDRLIVNPGHAPD